MGITTWGTLAIALTTITTNANAESVRVLKVFQNQGIILVDKGTYDDVSVGTRLEMDMPDGSTVMGQVKAASGVKSKIMLPRRNLRSVWVGAQIEYAVHRDDERPSRRPASSMGYKNSYRAPKGKNQLKGALGMASAGYNSALALGADYVVQMSRTFNLSPGITYMGGSTGNSLTEGSDPTYSFMTLDVGANYQTPINREMMFEIGGRLGLYRSSVSVPTYSLYEDEIGAENSEDETTRSSMGLLISPSTSVTYKLTKDAAMGAELRLPLSNSGTGSGLFYFLATLRFVM